MSFLERINNKNKEAVGAEGAAKKPNPLAARKNPLLARKAAPAPEAPATAETVEQVAPVVEEKTVVAPVEAVVPVVEETPVAEAPAKEEQKVVEFPVKEAVEPAPAEVKEEPAEAVQEEVKEAEPVEPVAEEKPKPKRSRAKKPATPPKEDTAEGVEPKQQEESFYEIPTTQVGSFAEVLEAIRTPFVDETWEAFKDEIVDDLSNIVIADDLNAGMLKVTVAELSILREKLWLPLQEAKNEFDRFTSKEPEGFIERVKRVNATGGANETERRRSGILACMNYETPAGKVNLYEALDDVRERYNFLKAAMDSVKFKTDILITMNGALKLEKEHL